jgi:hypothetical protein
MCSHVAGIAQGLKGMLPKKKFIFVHRILGFHYLFILVAYMVLFLLRLLQFECEVFDLFLEILQVPQC